MVPRDESSKKAKSSRSLGGGASPASLKLTEQLQQEFQAKGLRFKLMLVGESGTGKSTFVRSLFRPYIADGNCKTSSPEPLLNPGETIAGKTQTIQELIYFLDNEGYPIEITVVDCPGYGDFVDHNRSIQPVLSYILDCFKSHFDVRQALKQDPTSSDQDHRVHCCLYFIAAHRLKGLDIEFMKRLQKSVNIVPVVAKSDTMTVPERNEFRRLILKELEAEQIRIFEFEPAAHAGLSMPSLDTMLQGSDGKLRAQEKGSQPPPFAICASETGTREYPWGDCDVENENHSDLPRLRSWLFQGNLLAAQRKTQDLYEESYAAPRRLQERDHLIQQERLAVRHTLLMRMCMVAGSATSMFWLCKRHKIDREVVKGFLISLPRRLPGYCATLLRHCHRVGNQIVHKIAEMQRQSAITDATEGA